MAKQNQIARSEEILSVKDIEIVPVYVFPDKNNNRIDDRLESDLQRVILSDYYEAANERNGFWTRVGRFLSASNKAGRGFKAVKDFVLLFFPWGTQATNLSEFITETFIKEDEMRQEAKKPTKSKTLIVNIVIALASVAVLVGWIPSESIDLSPDAAWVPLVVSGLNFVLRFFTKQPVSTDA